MEKNEKKCKVLLLASNDTLSSITMYHDDKFNNCELSLNHDKLQYHTNYHLYITSDDEIKEGDWIKWYVKPFNKEWVSQVTKEDMETAIMNNGHKVVATTDKSLFGPFTEPYPKGVTNPLPQPSESFIQKYIESYNTGTPITEVMVEYTKNPQSYKDLDVLVKGKIYPDFLMVNPKDNTITIRKIKDNWNSLEISGLLRRFENECFLKFYKDKDHTDRVLFLGEFIERNL